jgi:DNA-binding MarR family transcriptional regulator
MSSQGLTALDIGPGGNVVKPEGPIRTFIRTYGLFRRVMDPYFAQFGLSNSQWAVLRVLHRAESEGVDTLRLTDLSSRLLVRPPSVTGVVDRLVRMGLIKSSKSPEDHRAKEVSLTQAGRKMANTVLEKIPQQIESILGGLNADEQQHLQHLLAALASRLEALAGKLESDAGNQTHTARSRNKNKNRNGNG